MDCLILMNSHSGTLLTTDMEALEAHILSEFERAGHAVSLIRIDQVGMDQALEQARGSEAELLIAAGGDGTVSALASLAWDTGKILGVLPGGTMNLYAKTLGIPGDIFEAVSTLARGEEDFADIATANGVPFINQYAIGFHPRAVKLRNKMDYSSRLGKIWATLKALFSVMTDPPSMGVEIVQNNGEPQAFRIAALSVSNNMLGTGHDLFADRYDGHVLGVYRTPRVKPSEAVRLILDLILGTWADNDKVIIGEARQLTLRFARMKRNAKALRDGELVDLPDVVEFETLKDALRVWVARRNTSKYD